MNEDRTTAREIAQDKMNNQIMYELGEIKGTMTGIKDGIEAALRQLKNHEERISDSETALSNVKLKIGIIGAIFGAAVSMLGNWFWAKITGH